MPNDALPSTEASTSTVAPSSTVDLFIAGLRIRLLFAPELAELADEIRGLWAHVADEDSQDGGPGGSGGPIGSGGPGEPGGPSGSTDTGADSDRLTLRFTTADSEPADEAAVRSSRLKAGDPSNAFTVSGRLTTAVIRELTGTRILLHSGAIELPDLGTVLVVGPSGAGKSTSTTAIGQRGTYLTDELTILDPEDFRVTGYPKPVSRVVGPGGALIEAAAREVEEPDPEDPDRAGSTTAGAAPVATGGRSKSDFSPESQGLRPGAVGAAPSHILLLDRHSPDEFAAVSAASASDDPAATGGDPEVAVGDPVAAAGTPEVATGDPAAAPAPRATAERTPTTDALHTLAAQSSSTWLVDHGLCRLMQLLDRCGGALTVRYHEATDLAEQLPELVRLPPHRPEWRHIAGRDSTTPGPGEYAVSAFSDAIALADSFVVLRKGALVSTQGLGALVWDVLELSGALTRDELLREVVAVLGENDQAGELLDSALASLVGEQLIVHDG